MNRIKLNYVCLPADADGIASATECTGAGPWTPDVANGPSDGLAHKVTITSTANLSAITATILGFDADGVTITEDISLPNNTTVTTTGYFASVIGISLSATAGASTATVGWAIAAVSPWKQNSVGLPMGFGCTVTTGSPTYSVQYTYDGEAAFDHADVTDVTVNTTASMDKPFQAIRLEFTAAGGVKFTGLQY